MLKRELLISKYSNERGYGLTYRVNVTYSRADEHA